MDRSFVSATLTSIADRLMSVRPDLSSVEDLKTLRLEHIVIGTVPEEVLRMLVLKQVLKEENRSEAVTEAEREINLLWIQALDTLIRIGLQLFNEGEYPPRSIFVSKCGKVFSNHRPDAGEQKEAA